MSITIRGVLRRADNIYNRIVLSQALEAGEVSRANLERGWEEVTLAIGLRVLKLKRVFFSFFFSM